MAKPSLAALEEAASSLPLDGGVVRVADLGCSHGRNSIAAMRVMVKALAQRLQPNERLALAVTHEDLPGNDFKTLFDLLDSPATSYVPHPSTSSPQELQVDVFPAVVGRSFYRPLFPPASIHLIYASATLHWLSRVPLRPSNAVTVYLCPDRAVVEAAREQGRQDMARFLALRAVETLRGAPLIFNFPILPEGSESTIVPHTFVHRTLSAMLAAGRLQGAEVAAMAAHEFYRPLADLMGPIADASEQWQLTSLESHTVELTEYAAYSNGALSAAQAGAAVVNTLRAVFTDIYVAGLSATRAPEEAAALVQELFAGAEALAVAEVHIPCSIHIAYVQLNRK